MDKIDLQRVDNINNEITHTNTATIIGTYWFSLIHEAITRKRKRDFVNVKTFRMRII